MRREAVTQYCDVIQGPLWDSVTVDPRCVAVLFMVPVGQGSSIFAPGAKNSADTNMLLSGQIAAGMTFQVNAVDCEPLFGAPREALEAITFRLIIGNRWFVEIPASRATCRLTIEERARGLMLPGMKWSHSIERKPLQLEPTVAFHMDVMSYATAPVSIRVALDGFHYRPLERWARLQGIK